jgi:endoglycosylceramidase
MRSTRPQTWTISASTVLLALLTLATAEVAQEQIPEVGAMGFSDPDDVVDELAPLEDLSFVAQQEEPVTIVDEAVPAQAGPFIKIIKETPAAPAPPTVPVPVVPAPVPVDGRLKVHRNPGEASLLRDGYGRSRLFHGLCLGVKYEPWLLHVVEKTATVKLENPLDFGPDDADRMQSWGFNVVRLAILWPGIETSKGVYDFKYLTHVKQIVDMLASRGIYTLLDLHSDIGSEYFCGEGIPNFYVAELLKDPNSLMSRSKKFPYPSNASYIPQPYLGILQNSVSPEQHSRWCANLLKKAGRNGDFGFITDSAKVGAMWNSLYTPGTELNKGFIRLWGVISKFFSDPANDSPFIIGYELINEPAYNCVNGDTDCHPKAATQATASLIYEHLYKDASAAIRVNDPKRLIFFEAMLSEGIMELWKELTAPVDAYVDHNSVYSYHVYTCAYATLLGINDCDTIQRLQIDAAVHYAKAVGTGAFMTEFGSVGAGQPNQELHVERLVKAAESHMQSWIYWQYKSVHSEPTTHHDEGFYNATTGKVDMTKFAMLTPPYCRAAQGTHTGMHWNKLTQVLTVSLILDSAISAPTEIFMGPNPGQPTISYTGIPADGMSVHRDRNLLYLTSSNGHSGSHPVNITVHIPQLTSAINGALQ